MDRIRIAPLHYNQSKVDLARLAVPTTIPVLSLRTECTRIRSPWLQTDRVDPLTLCRWRTSPKPPNAVTASQCAPESRGNRVPTKGASSGSAPWRSAINASHSSGTVSGSRSCGSSARSSRRRRGSPNKWSSPRNCCASTRTRSFW